MTKEDTIEFKKTMDARDWANHFNDVLVSHNEQPIDPEFITGWFANAIMFGYDEGRKADD